MNFGIEDQNHESVMIAIAVYNMEFCYFFLNAKLLYCITEASILYMEYIWYFDSLKLKLQNEIILMIE